MEEGRSGLGGTKVQHLEINPFVVRTEMKFYDKS